MRAFAAAMLLCCLSVAACGFRPMYGSHAPAPNLAVESGVEIANIPNRDGQLLRNFLMDRMYQSGRPADAPYLLVISPLKVEVTELGIRKDATATRAMQQVSANLTLTERATNRIVLQRDVRAVGGYNLLDNQFATIVSERSVGDHMLEEMADSIVTEVSLYFSRVGDNRSGDAR